MLFNINNNLKLISNKKIEILKIKSEINKEINNKFNFLNLIKDDFGNAKACILCCNLNESDQKNFVKLGWSHNKKNQEENRTN